MLRLGEASGVGRHPSPDLSAWEGLSVTIGRFLASLCCAGPGAFVAAAASIVSGDM